MRLPYRLYRLNKTLELSLRKRLDKLPLRLKQVPPVTKLISKLQTRADKTKLFCRNYTMTEFAVMLRHIKAEHLFNFGYGDNQLHMLGAPLNKLYNQMKKFELDMKQFPVPENYSTKLQESISAIGELLWSVYDDVLKREEAWGFRTHKTVIAPGECGPRHIDIHIDPELLPFRQQEIPSNPFSKVSYALTKALHAVYEYADIVRDFSGLEFNEMHLRTMQRRIIYEQSLLLEQPLSQSYHNNGLPFTEKRLKMPLTDRIADAVFENFFKALGCIVTNLCELLSTDQSKPTHSPFTTPPQ